MVPLPTFGSAPILTWGLHELPEGFCLVTIVIRRFFDVLQRRAEELASSRRRRRHRNTQRDIEGNSAQSTAQHKPPFLRRRCKYHHAHFFQRGQRKYSAEQHHPQR